VPWPNAAVAAWQMAWIWSVLRRIRLLSARSANPVTVTTTQGETYEEAVQNLKEATSLYLDEFPMKVHSNPATSYNFDFNTRNVTRLSKNTISHWFKLVFWAPGFLI
jgi:hypothetical protein